MSGRNGTIFGQPEPRCMDVTRKTAPELQFASKSTHEPGKKSRRAACKEALRQYN
jgi:hypothetical protein